MKTKVQKRLALLASLLLLSLLVFATGIQAAQAAQVQGTRAASDSSLTQLQLPTLAQIQQHHGAVANVAAVTPAAGTQGRGGVNLAPVTLASAAQPASSGTSSRTAWIVAGSAAAVLAVLIAGIAAWALVRRRRQPGESALATYCARHPEAPVCAAA